MSEPQERDGQHRRDEGATPDQPRSRTSEYPIWFRMLIVALLTCGLLYQLFVRGDVATSLALAGIIGGALGLNEVFGGGRRNNGGGGT